MIRVERRNGARASERGVALLVTLLAVTLLTVVVIEFTYSTEVDAHLSRNALNAMQARYLARSGLVLGEMALKLDAVAKHKVPPERPPVETLADPWAQPFAPMPVADNFGTAGFTIVDQSARFNLNALAVRPAAPNDQARLEVRKQLFQGILTALGIGDRLLFAVLDWLDPDDEVSSESGAEKEYYLALAPPYLPRNGPFLTLDELALVRGFGELTRPQWTALRKVLAVRPNGDQDLRINVNTAPELLLAGIFAPFDAGTLAHAIVSQRADRPFLSTSGLAELPGWSQLPPAVQQIFDVRSDVFTIHASGNAAGVERGLAVTERMRANVFPPQLEILAWREEVGFVALTSKGASDGMNSAPL